MPISSGLADFADLKAHLRASYAKRGRPLSEDRLNAATASTAARINPEWRHEAAVKAAQTRAARGEKPFAGRTRGI